MDPRGLEAIVRLSHELVQLLPLLVPPLLGATVVFENSASPLELLRTVKKERATAVIAVPRMLDALRGGIEREVDARGWRPWFDAALKRAEGRPFLKRAWIFRRVHRMFGWRVWAFT